MCELAIGAQPRKHNTTKWLPHVVQIGDDDDGSHDDDLEDEDEDEHDCDRAFSVGHATPMSTH